MCLDKILTQLAYPLGLAVVLAVLGLFLIWRRRTRWGLVTTAAGLVWLTLWSLPAVSDRLRLSLESRFDNIPAEQMPAAEVAIVLGGGERGSPPDWPYPDLKIGADRIWHAARLYHAGKVDWLLVSGGAMDWQGERQTGSAAMQEFLLALGVPESAILMEEESRNTRENAVYSAEIIRQQQFGQVMLVTSALHMRRALATFKAVGIEAVPAAADFEVMPEPTHALRWFPDAEALHDSARALKEYLGYWVYRWRGWAE